MDTISQSPNPLVQMSSCGTSVWLDFVSRSLLQKGELAHMVAVGDVRGVTSNPSIFEKAIAHSDEYDADLISFEKAGDQPVSVLFEHLAVGDIQAAADVLREVYVQSGGVDGYISLEVSPYLALKTEDTINEARHLWKAVSRDNLMVKVPGTQAGTPAIRTLIGEGININVTLLFSINAYKAVAEAYMAGLEDFAARGGDPRRMASVASFFISRIDSAVDKLVQAKLGTATADEAARLAALRGKVAIANAKLAYQAYKEMIATPRWQALAAKGAHPQRLLWASTGTKLSGLPDTLYVDGLIGPDTVNTMPVATMEAMRDHGAVSATIEHDVPGAQATLDLLASCGLSLAQITADLVVDGVQQFADAADKLYGAVAVKRAAVLGGKAALQLVQLGDNALDQAVAAETERWRADGLVRKLWAGDKSLWTNDDEDRWVGWMGLVDAGFTALPELQKFQKEVAAAGFADVVLLGMGGSSLGPEVIAQTFGQRSGFASLHIVDSTDPAQLRSVRDAIDLDSALFIVSSKSGSTLEPNLFEAYFFNLVKSRRSDPGQTFVAVTDPGSNLERHAREAGYRHIFHGVPSVGGRYSVLSMFGLVPAAAIGVDVENFLAKTREMVRTCGPDVPPAINPGVQLGLAMGVLARRGRDKITFIASPGIHGIGAWLEQLIAESTGKQGHGIVPIDDEPLGDPSVYGTDRLFVYLELVDQPDPLQQAKVALLESAGQPVVRVLVVDKMHLGQEFFRFEIATAVAGAVIGINPFNQPDVEASKIVTRELTEHIEHDGKLPDETPRFSDADVDLFADDANMAALGEHATLVDYLHAHLGRIRPGDYYAMLAYLPRNEASIEVLQGARVRVRDELRVATAVGFGPRFLHSTGQAYKGGPNSGVFVQLTCADQHDLAVPGHGYSFSSVKAAQARGDLQVLNERGRRVIRIHFKASPAKGLATLSAAIAAALRDPFSNPKD